MALRVNLLQFHVYLSQNSSSIITQFCEKLFIFEVVQMLITLLESADREVVFCSCGVLINLMVDNENRQIFQENKGVRK